MVLPQALHVVQHAAAGVRGSAGERARLCKHASDLRLNCATPHVERDRVRGTNRELLIHKPSPRFVVGGRNRRQQGKAGGDRRSECAGEAIAGDFELPELVQQDKVTTRCGVALHRFPQYSYQKGYLGIVYLAIGQS